MIVSAIKPEGYANWTDVPVSVEEDVLAKQADLRFSASTSLSEKVTRVFNTMMFVIAGAKILSFIPPVAAAGSALGGYAFAAISGTAVMQISAVATIVALAPKIIVTLAFLLVVRKILAVAIYHIIYPAIVIYHKESVTSERWELFKTLTQEKFECRRVCMDKSGISYDAFAFEHETTKGNGQWVVIAGGNCMIGEYHGDEFVRDFKEKGFNVLFVNGPGVGCSTWFPTSYSIGAGQEAGLQFLEKVAGAKKILQYGLSLGGGAIGEAVQYHDYKVDEIDYLVWSDRSFDTLSNAASSMVTKAVKPIFFLLGIELNGVKGAKKLQELGIPLIVTQNSQLVAGNGLLPLDLDGEDAGTDGVIPNATSMYAGLKKAGLTDENLIKCYGGPDILHDGGLPWQINQMVYDDIQAFLAK